jgi:hypothetical protein
MREMISGRASMRMTRIPSGTKGVPLSLRVRRVSPVEMILRVNVCQREKKALHGPDDPETCRCQLRHRLSSPQTGFGMLDRMPFPPPPSKPLEPPTGDS